MNYQEKNGGITLIALVVTIIVLLILAGISITMLTGQNGILNKAGEAKEKTEVAQIKEMARLEILEKHALSSNGKITSNELRIILDKYLKNVPEILPEDETELKNLELKSKEGDYPIKVGEIWTGSLEKNPSEGDLVKGKKVTETNAEWKDDTNQYPAVIPVGFCVVTDAGTIAEGLVISDVENDDMANTKKGNQFVWIPVNDYSKFHLIEGYKDRTLQNLLGQIFDPPREAGDTEKAGSPLENNNVAATEESKAMYNSVKLNHGFYIARYEAGIEGNTDNYNLSTKTATDGSVKPLSQKDVGVWNAIPWGGAYSSDASDRLPGNDAEDGAVKVARSMYTKSKDCGVTSTLCYGVQWDAVMNFIDEKYVETQGNLTSFVANSENKGNYNGGIKPTGYYAEKNIYDLAGSVCEWTMEAHGINRVYRGGSYDDDGLVYPASIRLSSGAPTQDYWLGMRVALYL